MSPPDDTPTPHHTTVDFRFAPIPEELLFDTTVSSTAVRLWGVLARHGLDPDSCFPSTARLAGLLGRAQRTVPLLLAELETAGWLTRHARFAADGGRTSNRFELHSTRKNCRGAPPHQVQGGSPPSGSGGSPLRTPGERESLKESHLKEKTNTHARPGTRTRGDDASVAFGAGVSFDAFWACYPRRHGKRVGRRPTLALWEKLGDADRTLVMTAVRNYAAACNADVTLAKDPARWLRDRELWSDVWQTPAARRGPNPDGNVDRDRNRPAGRLKL